MTEEYSSRCWENNCDEIATVEIQTKTGNWIPFCKEHVPERAWYVRKIQVRKDD